MVNFNPFKKQAAPPASPASLSDKLAEEANVLANYEVRAELGKGGFGVVSRIHERGKAEGVDIAVVRKFLSSAVDQPCECLDQKIVPIQLLKDTFRGDMPLVQQRLRRMRKFVQNVHPNLIRVSDYKMDRENLYIFLELCEGGDLFERIINSPAGRLSEKDSRDASRALCSVVAHCHWLGTVHRDIKPENLFFKRKDSPFDSILLADFSCMTDEQTETSTMTEGAGSPGYISPEMAARKPYTMLTDEWSLGVTIYEMLTGRSPFRSENAEELRAEVQHRAIPYPKQYWSRISPEGMDFVQKFLEKDPSKRMSAKQALEHPWLAQREPVSRSETAIDKAASTQSDEPGEDQPKPTRQGMSTAGFSFYDRPETASRAAKTDDDASAMSHHKTEVYGLDAVMEGRIPQKHLSRLQMLDAAG